MGWGHIGLVLSSLGLFSCGQGQAPTKSEPAPAPAQPIEDDLRERMVKEQIERRGVEDPRVLAAMRKVERHVFVPSDLEQRAYTDHPLPIGFDVTISQPYIVALMSELAAVGPGDRVLEVGTGSGYQTAVLAEMGAEVFSIEIIDPLAKSSAALLKRLGYDQVQVKSGDGYQGWPEHAPFDAIVVTAAPQRIPEPLKQQLKEGGRLVLPVGERWSQELKVVTRSNGGFSERNVIPVAFVPMTGEAQK